MIDLHAHGSLLHYAVLLYTIYFHDPCQMQDRKKHQPSTDSISMPHSPIFLQLIHVQKLVMAPPRLEDWNSPSAKQKGARGRRRLKHLFRLLLCLGRSRHHGAQALADLGEARPLRGFGWPALLHQWPPLGITGLGHRRSQRVIHDSTWVKLAESSGTRMALDSLSLRYNNSISYVRVPIMAP
jgi:hypothetical protein